MPAEVGASGRPVQGPLLWTLGVLPLVLLGGLLGLMLWSGPADALRGEESPPVEDLAFQRVELGPDGIIAAWGSRIFFHGPAPCG